jgi:hypothetical protein
MNTRNVCTWKFIGQCRDLYLNPNGRIKNISNPLTVPRSKYLWFVRILENRLCWTDGCVSLVFADARMFYTGRSAIWKWTRAGKKSCPCRRTTVRQRPRVTNNATKPKISCADRTTNCTGTSARWKRKTAGEWLKYFITGCVLFSAEVRLRVRLRSPKTWDRATTHAMSNDWTINNGTEFFFFSYTLTVKPYNFPRKMSTDSR